MSTTASLSFLDFPGKPKGRLRPLLESDLPLITCGVNNERVRPCFPNLTHPQTELNEREWLIGVGKKRDQIVLGIEVDHRKKPLLIGTMALNQIDLVHGTATTGTMIWDLRFQNRGIGSSAKMLLLYHAFERLNLRIVYSRVVAFNERSLAYAGKCGYREVARLPDRFQYGGRTYAEHILEVRREYWAQEWLAFAKTHRLKYQAPITE